jgi:Gram-negative bacterial TonB protein C-terminal
MRGWWWHLGLVACLVIGGVGWRYGAEIVSLGPVTPPASGPEDGQVAGGAYRNAYFDLSLPLPDDWTEGLAGPGPSATGYYVLGTLVPKGERNATILIAAQDMFFAEDWSSSAVAIDALHRGLAGIEGMTIDAGPTALTMAGRAMHRIDYSGVGLHRTMFATEIRCHLVSFTLTTREADQREQLRLSLNRLAPAAQGRRAAPPCVRDYVVADNLIERIEPDVSGATFEPIPVRLVIGTDGKVRRVHVIRASPAQRKALETALHQWRFKPPQIGGRPTEIETGLLFKSAVAAR